MTHQPMYRKTPLAALCFSLFLSLPLRGQEIALDSVMSNYEYYIQALSEFSKNVPREKVYLHFDNTSYYEGDKIWFKCYVTTPGRNQLSDWSKTLYVELLTPGGDVVDKRILRIENGQCHGDFTLNHIPFHSGFYEVRAYTRYMLNFGEEAIFSRVLPVYDKPATAGDYDRKEMMRYERASVDFPMKRIPPPSGKAVNISLFPEGGRLVSGVASRIAFEATDDEGNPIDVVGAIASDPAKTFASSHLGRGVFTYTPSAVEGRRGRDQVEVEYSGKKYRFDMPEALTTGVVMEVDNLSEPDSLLITLRKNRATPDQTLGVAVMSGGKLFNFIFANIEGDALSFKTSATRLPAGVSQIVLFDPGGRILCDRLVFIPCRDSDLLSISAKTDKERYSPLEKVEMEFSVTDKSANPVRGLSFSVAVRDAAGEVRYRSNILADLLLSSEIRGYIRDPLYYFESDDPLRRSELDLLLMVQGWRRYSWNQMVGLEPFELASLPEQGIETHGKVVSTGLINGKERSRPGVLVSLFLTPVEKEEPQESSSGEQEQSEEPQQEPGKSAVVGTVISDSLGRFNFTSNPSGKWNMVFGVTENGKKRDYQVVLDRLFSPAPRRYDYPDIAPRELEEGQTVGDDQMFGDLTQAAIDSLIMGVIGDSIHLVETVTVTAKEKGGSGEQDIYRNRSTSVAYYDVKSELDDLYDSGEYYNDLHSLLRSMNEYFSIRRDPDYDEVLNYKGKGALVVVNYTPVKWNEFEYFHYKTIRPEAVKSIYINESIDIMSKYVMPDSVVTSSQQIVSEYLRCVVFIETYPYGKIPVRPARGVRKTFLEGYSTAGEFYSPDYSILPPDNDYRRTLYWNPSVATDESGRAKVLFYNNSRGRRYKISAETVTPTGKIGVYR